MVERVDIYNPYPNTVVTELYVSVISEAVRANEIICNPIAKLDKNNSNKNAAVIVIAAKDAIRAHRCGYKTIILWTQGIIPEESYLRHHSRVRSLILSNIEKKALKVSDFLLYVSDAMRIHYEKKYNIKKEKYYIMPCFNDEIHESSFYKQDKYKNNTFIYAGGMDVWQCFEETVMLYKKIETMLPDTVLKVFTKDQDSAEIILKKHEVNNYSLGFVSPNQIGEEMANVKFGFSLREDNPVNNVATPTKISTYIAYGVIPIYSDCIKGFSEISEECKYSVRINKDASDINRIIELANAYINPDDVLQSMKSCYGEYFSFDYHKKNLRLMMKELLK